MSKRDLGCSRKAQFRCEIQTRRSTEQTLEISTHGLPPFKPWRPTPLRQPRRRRGGAAAFASTALLAATAVLLFALAGWAARKERRELRDEVDILHGHLPVVPAVGADGRELLSR